MPGFDGTGPAGMGPMTGWGQGYCMNTPSVYAPTPQYVPAYPLSGSWRGFGRALGFGRVRGNGRGFSRGRGYVYGRGYGRRSSYPARGRW